MFFEIFDFQNKRYWTKMLMLQPVE